jgi:hypothetical protein
VGDAGRIRGPRTRARSFLLKCSGLLFQAGKEVLVPFPADAMRAWPISPRVNSPKNNDLDLITSIGGLREYIGKEQYT